MANTKQIHIILNSCFSKLKYNVVPHPSGLRSYGLVYQYDQFCSVATPLLNGNSQHGQNSIVLSMNTGHSVNCAFLG